MDKSIHSMKKGQQKLRLRRRLMKGPGQAKTLNAKPETRNPNYCSHGDIDKECQVALRLAESRVHIGRREGS